MFNVYYLSKIGVIEKLVTSIILQLQLIMQILLKKIKRTKIRPLQGNGMAAISKIYSDDPYNGQVRYSNGKCFQL